MEFELACRGDDGNKTAADTPRQFPASLLVERDIAFLLGRNSASRVVGVAVANRTTSEIGDVVGLSNVIGKDTSAEDLWNGATGAVIAAFPAGLPLVGYEREDDLREATRIGFEPTRSLRVFMSDAVR